jgi:hypothetical protein
VCAYQGIIGHLPLCSIKDPKKVNGMAIAVCMIIKSGAIICILQLQWWMLKSMVPRDIGL